MIRIYQYQCQRAQDLVFYTQNIWNGPIKMECTKSKKKTKEAKNLHTHTLDWKAIEMRMIQKNSVTRIHCCAGE